jgi:hypothetical protein
MKTRRIIGFVVLVIAAVIALSQLPALYPIGLNSAGFAIVKRPDINRIAIGYLVTGVAAGFGLALLLLPSRPQTQEPVNEKKV